MRIQFTVAMMMFSMAANGWSGEKIQVYVNGGNIASAVLAGAEDTTSRILATAGVQISWRFGAPHPGKNTGIPGAYSAERPPRRYGLFAALRRRPHRGPL